MTSDRIFNIYQRTDAQLNKLESSQIETLEKILIQSYKDLEAKVRAAVDRANAAGNLTSREREFMVLEQLKDSLALINPAQAAVIEQQFNTLLADAGQVAFQATERVANLTNIDIEAAGQIAQTGLQQVKAVAQASDGTVRIGRAMEDFRLQAQQVIGAGVVRGDSIANITRALKQKLDVSRVRASTIVRTEVLAASNRVAQDTFERLGVEYLMFVATEDSVTCPYCLERAGNIYKLQDFPTPPIHPNCRCFSSPVDIDDPNQVAWADQHYKAALERSEVKPFRGQSPFERLNGQSEPQPVRRSRSDAEE